MSDSNHSDSSKHIIQSLVVNLVITVAKGFAAFMTKSGAMLAETIHSFADCSNQVLLLLGVKQAQKLPDSKHPFGYGRSVYFWSFMVAMLLFSIGGMFSIYEGVHKYQQPEPVENIAWGLGVLLFSLILEGYATYANVIEMNKRRASIAFFKYLKDTKDSDLVVVFGENSAAVLGLILASIGMLISYYTGDGRYDAMGSMAIGIVLILVAIFLAREVKSLLIGESADPEIYHLINDIAEKHPNIKKILQCKAIQQGPGEVLVCMKVKMPESLTANQLCDEINDFERQIRGKNPTIKWLYVEPDLVLEK